MNEERKMQLLRVLEEARNVVNNGQEISTEFARVLFPPERREYELTYYGKETKEQIIAQTYAAPLQEDRRFAGATTSEWTNMLIFGDNLQVLKSLIEMKRAGKLKNADGTEGVRLIYIDPPFASKQDFTNDEKAYSDKMKGAEFLEWLRKRLILLKEIMSVDGSIFVHLDWHKSHYMKVLMDEIFGEGNFINEIVWHYGTYVGNTKNNFPRKHDTILVYGRSMGQQFMGRINRSGKKTGKVYFYNLDKAKNIYRNDTRVDTDKTLESSDIREYLNTKDFFKYYENVILPVLLKSQKKITDDNIKHFFKEKVGKLNYPYVCEKMKLIEDGRKLISVYFARSIQAGDNVIDGADVWNEYKELIENPDLSYSERTVRIHDVRSKMNMFIYQFKEDIKSNIEWNEQIGDIYYIEDGEDYFDDNGVLKKEMIVTADELFI